MGWHQDFCFDPHSNDDVLTLVVFLDDQQLDNGPLKTSLSGKQSPVKDTDDEDKNGMRLDPAPYRPGPCMSLPWTIMPPVNQTFCR